jgi:hypothetical protein
MVEIESDVIPLGLQQVSFPERQRRPGTLPVSNEEIAPTFVQEPKSNQAVEPPMFLNSAGA